MAAHILIGSIVVMMSGFAMSARAAQAGSDEDQIRDVQRRQQEAWNRHDAKAYAALFTEDGDVVNVVGWWWKGRAEVEAKLTAAFAAVFRNSTLAIDAVDTRPFRATSPLRTCAERWRAHGRRPPFRNLAHGLQTQVLQKQNGVWRIAVFHNTNAVPEMPFPTELPR